MIRVLLCCGGGFSSSYVAERMKKEIIAKNLDNFDIIICCPHLNIDVKQLLEKTDVQVPIYILPPRMYGNMEIEEIYQDVIDLLEIYQQTHMNPVHFPGEENVLKITRQKAYKHVYQK